MFCRAKICGLLVIAGAITASAASLDVRQKSPVFSTEQTTAAVVIKPSDTRARMSTPSRWRRVKVQKIIPAVQSPGRVEVNGFVFNKLADVSPQAITNVSVAPEKK
jgi:hypothetical protein